MIKDVFLRAVLLLLRTVTMEKGRSHVLNLTPSLHADREFNVVSSVGFMVSRGAVLVVKV